eukprot:Skav206974  [mRNA]  locus=scaffold1394:16408:19084:- [translate_table: standard]
MNHARNICASTEQFFREAYYGSSNLGRSRHKTGTSRRPARHRPRSDDSFFGTGLILQEPPLRTVRGWLALQVFALILQFRFWREVQGNLSTYESTLSSNCASERSQHGICVGPLWNVSAWKEFVLQGRSSVSGEFRLSHYNHNSHMSRNHFDSIEAIDAEIAELQQETALRLKELKDKRAELQVIQGLVPSNGSGIMKSQAFNSSYIFQFETRSSPSVLLISVNPVAWAPRIGEDPPKLTQAALDTEHEGRHWNLEVKRVEPPPTGLNFQRNGFGTRIMTIEDMSQEAVDAVRQRGHVRWEAVLRNVEMSAHRTRFVVFVEDFQSPHVDHLEKLSKIYGTECSLTSSWRAFNREHQGHRHRALTLCRDLLGWLLPIGAFATWAVYARLVSRTSKGGLSDSQERSAAMELTLEDRAEALQDQMETQPAQPVGNHFQTVILIKLLVMDLPQQAGGERLEVCIVLYLLGWYEADGLRCQLCLFHPQHCEDEHPFRLANSATSHRGDIRVTEVTNQIIIGPAKRSIDDVCGQWTIRMLSTSTQVSILPFTTGVYWATSALLSLPVLMKAFVFLPCVFGWFCVMVP